MLNCKVFKLNTIQILFLLKYNKMYTLKIISHLDQQTKCYKKIISISALPTDELKNIVRRINPPKLSPFKYDGCCKPSGCIYVIISLRDCSELMCVDELSDLLMHISSLNYDINNNLSNLLMQNNNTKFDKEFLCFIQKK